MQQRTILAAVLFLLLLLHCGCVERRLLIKTDPDDAVIFLDDERIGRSPVEVPFVHYGTRRITAEKDDYELAVRMEPINTPWYQWFPLDLFFEAVFPFTITDQREVTVELKPTDESILTEEGFQALMQRGEALREVLAERLEERERED